MRIKKTVSVEVRKEEHGIFPFRDKDGIKGYANHEFAGDYYFMPEAMGYYYGDKRYFLSLVQDKVALKAEATLRGEFPEQFCPRLILESVFQAGVPLHETKVSRHVLASAEYQAKREQ